MYLQCIFCAPTLPPIIVLHSLRSWIRERYQQSSSCRLGPVSIEEIKVNGFHSLLQESGVSDRQHPRQLWRWDCGGQGVEYRIENLSNADISDFFVYRRVYRIEPPISSISICPRYAFILSFSAENSPKNPKILWKFRKFSGNSENSPKIQKIRRNFWKFAENSENSPKIH